MKTGILTLGLMLLLGLPSPGWAIESTIHDRATLEEKYQEVLRLALNAQNPSPLIYAKYAPEPKYSQELMILKEIAARTKELQAPVSVPVVLSHNIEDDGGNIVTQVIPGITASNFGEFLYQLRKQERISYRDQVLLAVHLYSKALQELHHLNEIGIIHVDNAPANFLLSPERISVIDFGDSEDARSETLFRTDFRHRSRRHSGLSSSDRIALLKEVEVSNSSELFTGLLGICDKGDSKDELPRLVEKLELQKDITEDWIEAFSKTFHLFFTEDEEDCEGMNTAEMARRCQEFLEQSLAEISEQTPEIEPALKKRATE